MATPGYCNGVRDDLPVGGDGWVPRGRGVILFRRPEHPLRRRLGDVRQVPETTLRNPMRIAMSRRLAVRSPSFTCLNVDQPKVDPSTADRPRVHRLSRHGLTLAVWAMCVGCWLTEPVVAAPLPGATASAHGEAALGPDLIFSDDFELGTTELWSTVVGLLPLPDAFRISDLDLRDPHVFVSLSPLCLDFTDTPIPLTDISFNNNVEALITTDDDMDGLLDLSLLMLFRPLDATGTGERVDFQNGACSAPLATTSCTVADGSLATKLDYDGLTAGTCLEALAGTTSGYSPGITDVAAPCFTTVAETLTVDLLGIPVTLQEGQLAAAFVGDPIDTLNPGLMRGFLSEADADAILIPADLPVIGGQPLSVLLPGGTGNCSPGDDRDLLNGVSGWWFYFQIEAQRVPFTGS